MFMNMHRLGPLLFVICWVVAMLLRAQELPEGAGKDITKRMCSGCHPLTTVTGKKASKDQWGIIVDRMVVLGAKGTDEEVEIVIEYLAANFGPKK
jgi:cytochrome c5